MEDKKHIYIAADMLSYGAQKQREWEKEQLAEIGYTTHAPQDDAEINDKSTVDNNGLAERIVKKDTNAIMESDLIILDAHQNGLGTMVEMGQLAGIKDLSDRLLTKIDELVELGVDYDKILNEITKDLIKYYNKEVYVYNTDIRRENTALQQGDRREYAPNQYVYGTALKLTNGKGFYEWYEIINELKNRKSE